MKKLPAPEAIITLVKCNCKKSKCSSNQCSCRRVDLSCTELCGCGADEDSCENHQDEVEAADEDEEEDPRE